MYLLTCGEWVGITDPDTIRMVFFIIIGICVFSIIFIIVNSYLRNRNNHPVPQYRPEMKDHMRRLGIVPTGDYFKDTDEIFKQDFLRRLTTLGFTLFGKNVNAYLKKLGCNAAELQDPGCPDAIKYVFEISGQDYDYVFYLVFPERFNDRWLLRYVIIGPAIQEDTETEQTNAAWFSRFAKITKITAKGRYLDKSSIVHDLHWSGNSILARQLNADGELKAKLTGILNGFNKVMNILICQWRQYAYIEVSLPGGLALTRDELDIVNKLARDIRTVLLAENRVLVTT
jgi:hypothetical protein